MHRDDRCLSTRRHEMRQRVPPTDGSVGQWSVEIEPEDLRIDVAKMVGGGPCGVRVTHVPTGTNAWADDQVSTEANRDLVVARLREKMSEI